MSIHLREKLDNLLFTVENGSNGTLQEQIAWMLDIIPRSLPEINRDILVLEKPKLKALLGRWKPLARKAALEELRDLRTREDIIGRVGDLIYRIAIDDHE